MVNNFLKYITLLYFSVFQLNFEYIVRLGFAPEYFQIYNQKLLVVFIAIITILFKLKYIVSEIFLRKKLFYITIYIISATILSFTFFASGVDVPYSKFNRFIVQISNFICSIALAYVLASELIKNPDLYFKFLKYGFYISFASVFLQVIFNIYPEGVYRLCGILGEPKSLGIYLTIFLICYLYTEYNYKYKFITKLIIILAIFGTFSSTATIALIFLFYFYSIFDAKFFSSPKTYLFLILIFATMQIDIVYDATIKRFFDMYFFEESSPNQVLVQINYFGNLLVEGNDAPAINFINNNPLSMFTGVGYGLGTIFYDKYLTIYGGAFLNDISYDGYITPNIGIVNSLMNFGIVGVLFFSNKIIGFCKGIFLLRNIQPSLYFICLFLASNSLIGLFLFTPPIGLVTSIYTLFFIFIKSNNFNLKYKIY